jgi:glutamate--cysteine ligase
MLAWAFEPGMSFERWVDYALDVPMYFVKHGDEYVDASGQSFRDLMAGKLPAMPGVRASISDWANHLSTIFPEVRLKRYLEMRGADSGSLPNLLALPAFWVGILYDDVSLDAAWDLVKGWTASERQKLRDDVPKQGLAATLGGRTVFEIANDVLKLARAGLARRKCLDAAGQDETHYLEVLEDRLARGTTPAQELLEKFYGPWGGSVDPIYAEEAY